MAQQKKNIQYYQAVGRRKESVARVRLYLCTKEKTLSINGKKYDRGDIIINDQKGEQAYNRIVDQNRLSHPFDITETKDRFVITIRTEGGGKIGQLDAIVHGIARALVLVDEDEYKGILRQEGYLTRDSRTRERRKVGTGGKARKAKQSPKR